MFQKRIGSGIVQEVAVIRKGKSGELKNPLVMLSVGCGAFVQKLMLPSAMALEAEDNADRWKGQFAVYQATDSVNYRNEVESSIGGPRDLRILDGQAFASFMATQANTRDLLEVILPAKAPAKAGAA
jgi:hypothetical protein